MTATEPTTRDQATLKDRTGALVTAATLFTLAVLVHNADHARRGADSVSKDVFWIGTAAIALEIAVVVLVVQRHRLAPLAAAAAGWSLAAGYVVVHFLPQRSWLSDSFTSASDVSPLSWGAATFEVIAAVLLGAAGMLALRDRGGLVSAMRPDPHQSSLQSALLHPAALAMIVGNAVILAISFSQL